MESNRRILVVDDQEDLRNQVAKMLTKRGGQNETSSLIEQIRNRISRSKESPTPQSEKINYSVDTVGQGKEAYELVKESFAKKEPYSVMFLDMRMPPGWDGLETAQRIRAIDKEVQIVIMTAYADYEQQEIADLVGGENLIALIGVEVTHEAPELLGIGRFAGKGIAAVDPDTHAVRVDGFPNHVGNPSRIAQK